MISQNRAVTPRLAEVISPYKSMEGRDHLPLNTPSADNYHPSWTLIKDQRATPSMRQLQGVIDNCLLMRLSYGLRPDRKAGHRTRIAAARIGAEWRWKSNCQDLRGLTSAHPSSDAHWLTHRIYLSGPLHTASGDGDSGALVLGRAISHMCIDLARWREGHVS